MHVFPSKALRKNILGVLVSSILGTITQFAACPTAAWAEVTGSWALNGNSGGTSSVLGIGVRQDGYLGGPEAYENITFTSGPYFDTPYPGTVGGGPGLWFSTPNNPDAIRTVTISFGKPIDDPVLHVDRIGGAVTRNGATASNSSVWRLSASQSQSGSVSMSKRSGNAAFDVGPNYFQRVPNVQGVVFTQDCRLDAYGTGCGSIQFNGKGITSLTFSVSSAGATNNGNRPDGLAFRWSFVGSTIKVVKESIGSVGSFSFNGNQGIGSFGLNTVQSNPANSAEFRVQDHTQPINISEAVPVGMTMAAQCVDQNSQIVPSTLSEGAISVPASSYAGNEQITCKFTNTKQSTLQISKQTEGGVGTFAFTGTNGFVGHNITTSLSGVAVDGPVRVLETINTATSITEAEDDAYYPPEIYCSGLGQGGNYSVSGYTVRLDEAATAAGAAIRCRFINRLKRPRLEVTKVVDRERVSVPGRLAYTIKVRNTGDGSATNVSLIDVMPDGSDGILTGPSGDGGVPGVLEAGETWTYTASYDVSQTDIDAGETLSNRVSVTSTEMPNAVTAEAETLIDGNPALQVVKRVDKNRTHLVGDVLTYTITVKNIGNVTQTNISLADILPDGTAGSLAGPTGDSGTPGALDVGETWTYTGSYTVTQDDLQSGVDLVNTVTVRSDQTTVPVQDDAITEISQQYSLSIDKVVDKKSTQSAGDILTYTIRVRNTGNVALDHVSVTDTLPDGSIAALVGPSGDINGNGKLDPDEIWAWTTTYAVTQADIDQGNDLINNVSAIAEGVANPVRDEATTGIATKPGIDIKKDVDRDSISAPGQLHYTITVSNTGNVTLEDVSIIDVLPDGRRGSLTGPSGDTNDNGKLDVDEQWVYTVSYDVTQDEIDAGRDIVNNATVTASDPGGTFTDSDSAATTVNKLPRIDVTKEVDRGVVETPGTLTYTVRAKNTGNVSLKNIRLVDTLSNNRPVSVTGPVESDPDGILEVGESWTWAVTYEVTQADIDAGSPLINTASVTGSAPDGTSVSAADDATSTIKQAPKLAVSKVVDKSSTHIAGDVLTYTIRVKNTGNLAQTGIVLTDTLPNGEAAVLEGPTGDEGIAGTLEPGEVWTYLGRYVVSQSDINNGKDLVNTVSVQSVQVTTPVSDSALTRIEKKPALLLRKVQSSGPSPATAAGQMIGYTITVTNFGNIDQTGILLVDILPNGQNGQLAGPSGDESIEGTLEVGETWTWNVTYTVTQQDIDRGDALVNRARVTSDQVPDPVADSATTPIEQMAELTLIKTAGSINDANHTGRTDAGDTITYMFEVRNTGTTTIANVTVDDAKLGQTALPVTPSTLAPGEKGRATATYTLTQSDIDAGKVNNTAKAKGKDPAGKDISDDDTVTTPVTTVASLAIEKRAGEPSGNRVGSTIDYTFTVTNTGTITLTGVTVTDELEGAVVTGGPIDLVPGQVDSTTFKASYALTQADIDAGKVDNTATAKGTPANGANSVTSDPGKATALVEQTSKIELTKSGRLNDVDGIGAIEAGDTITYTFEVTNSGNVRVDNVTPVDAGPIFNGKSAGGQLGAFTPASAAIDPGKKQVFTTVYVLTQEDIDNGAGIPNGVTNVATAVGERRGPDGDVKPVESEQSRSVVSLPAAAPSDIEITKQAGLRQIRRGEKAPFIIKVTNKSNRFVTGLNVTDRIPSGFRLVDGSTSIDGQTVTPVVNGNRVAFENLQLAAHGEVILRLQMQALSTAGPGKHTNVAVVVDASGNRLAPEARASIEIMIEPVFDCGEIIGRVFDDLNGNGYQDDGEPGLPGVRVVTVRGKLITTDKFGRFHVACADLPDPRIGSNFIMKLDERTLPAGYRMTTENPRVVRLTAGKMTKLNFGASIGRVVRLDLKDDAFVAGTTRLKPQWQNGLEQLVATLVEKQSTLHINYVTSRPDLASQRLKTIEMDIQNRWKRGRRSYQLNIETRLEVRP